MAKKEVVFRILVIIVVILFSVIVFVKFCGTEGKISNRGGDTVKVDTTSLMTTDDFVQNIASPLEIANLIKSLKVPFSKDYLASTKKVNIYVTSSKQALMLGIYGADLGYLNMYNRNTNVLEYLKAINEIAEKLSVEQFFNFSTLRQLATNSQNLDSLMYISVRNFNDMDRYLLSQKRDKISVLMITGAWIEGLYIATRVAQEKSHPELSEKIGEQKIALENLMLILQNYSNHADIKKIINELDKLQQQYNDIHITYEYGECIENEIDGELVYEQTTKSTVHIPERKLDSIIFITGQVRNNLIEY